MKKIILFLIFIQGIFASSELLLPINEYKTDIYFGNGILTTEKDAEKGLDLIEEDMLERMYDKNETKMLMYHGFDLAC